MRSKLAIAGLVAGAAAFVAPAGPASAYCAQELIAPEGGGSGQCTNGCYEAGEAYENVRTSLPGGDKVPGYWDLFACLD